MVWWVAARAPTHPTLANYAFNEKNGGQAGFYIVVSVKDHDARLPTLLGYIVHQFKMSK
jgi:hypothetical protein